MQGTFSVLDIAASLRTFRASLNGEAPIVYGTRVVQTFHNVGAVSLRIVVAASLIALGACNTTYLEQRTDEPQNAADVVRSADLQPRRPQPTGAVDNGGEGSARSFSFFGSPSPAATPRAPAPGSLEAEADGGGYTLNFEDTPVATVAKSVLGDILGVGYAIDPRAQGSITLSSGRPIAKRDMLFVLENALHANNLNMVRDASGYRIVSANDGSVGAADHAGGSGAEPGYGITVIPLRYVSGSTLSKLLEGFAARPGAIRTDPAGKILIVVGTGSERQSALDTVRSFDVDWLQGQSVGMYPVKNSTPEPIVSELEKIMDSGESGLGHGLVKFETVTRLNSILVVAAKPELLRDAARWISRLDEPTAATASVKVYKVRYGDAKQIAEMLTQIFVAGGGSAEAPTNEIAPSSGVKALTTEQRLTGGRPVDSTSSAPGGATGPNSRGAAGPPGGVPVAALNAELGALGFGQGGGGPQFPNVRISADTVNNSVLIYANAEEYKTIERTLNQLDRPRLQVAIDVTIAEVTLNDELNYGVQFFLSNGAVSNTLTGTIPSLANNLTTSPVGPPLTGGLNVILGNSLAPRVVINALHNLTDVKILSNPSLVVVDNGEATLEVGDQVPISTGSATVLSANNAVVNTVDYKNTGIILHVQPRVNSNGSVLLNIDQEISAVEPPAGSTANTQNLTPTISERKVTSEISVVSGQTVLLAGLIQDQQEKSREGIPILNQLPFVGAAFGTTGKSQTRTELIIFIQPQIIRDGVDAAKIAEELRSKMRGGKVQAITLPSMLNVLSRPAQ
jgi:general secretion pathway protein D